MVSLNRLNGLGRRRTAGLTLIGLGLVGLVWANLHASAPSRPHTPTPGLVAKGGPKPAAKQVAAYTVPPSYPRYIAIPAIGLTNVPVRALGLAADGTITTPNSVYETGWYNQSSKPGQPGVMFVYGHIADWTKYAAFQNLSKVRLGDEIVITRGDNTVFRYQVTALQTYPYNAVDMVHVLSTTSGRVPSLNLMTCAGNIITVDGVKEYSQRLVVFTRQM